MRKLPDSLICQGECRQKKPLAEYQYRDWKGRDRRRSLCRDCWRKKEEIRRADERLKDIERAKHDNSPFGVARREVEAMTKSVHFPEGVHMNDWHERGLDHLHHIHYEIMFRIWYELEQRRRIRLTMVRAEEISALETEQRRERAELQAQVEALTQAIMPVDGLLDDLGGDFDDDD